MGSSLHEKADTGQYVLQEFPYASVKNARAATEKPCSSVIEVFRTIAENAFTITEGQCSAAEYRELVDAKFSKTLTKKQKDRYDALKGQAQLYRGTAAATGEKPTRGNAVTTRLLVIDCDGSLFHPQMFAPQVAYDFRASVATFGSASNLGESKKYAYRLVLALDRPVDETELRELSEFVKTVPYAGKSGVDDTAGELSRMHYYPTQHESFPNVNNWEDCKGDAVDVDAILERARKVAKKTRAVARKPARPRVQLSDAALEVEAAVFAEAMRAAYDFSDRSDFIIAGMSAKSFGAEHGQPDLMFAVWCELAAEAWGKQALQRSYADEWASFHAGVRP